MIKSDELLAQYRQFLDSLHPVSDQDWAFYSSFVKLETYKKGEFFLRVGDPGNRFGFVARGLFKQYFTSYTAESCITSFVPENRMISDFVALIKCIPARTDIVALEDSTVLVIAKQSARQEMATNATWEAIGRILAESRYIEKEDKEWDFLHLDATARYEKFCREKSGLLNRISQNDIASYLGISNVSLSRIRRGLAGKK